jgi:hypothetical protein
MIPCGRKTRATTSAAPAMQGASIYTLSHSNALSSQRGRLSNNETALQKRTHAAEKSDEHPWAAPETREGPHTGRSGRDL